MRRWLGWTWVLLLVCVAAVSMCGSRKPGYGSGYALTSAGYSRGNTWAGFYDDTLTVVFTTQDVLTAGVLDTTKVGTASSPAAPYDSQRRDTFKARLAEADTIHRLGAGFKVAAFAHGLVDTTEPEGYGTPSGYQSSMQAGIRVGAGPYTHNRTYNVAGRRSELFYIPFEKYIPSGSTIISATVNVSANTNADATTADSLYANLITTPDDKWYTAKRGSFFADYAKTAWSRQISNNPTGSITWSATNSDPWVPGISAGRTGFKSWGTPEDQTALPGAIASRRQVDFSIKNCVQAAVSGSTNNGIIVNLGWKTNGFQALFNHYFWDDYSDATARTPYVVVKYTKRRYAGALDMTPPSAPSMGVTYASNGYVYVSWTNNSSEPVTFNLYRFFDNAADTTLVAGAVSGLNAFDFGAVNGSPHNYFVRAVDRSGNLSAPSSASRLFPGYIRSITRPAYYALWFQDAPNIGTDENEWTIAEWQAKLDSLSLFDAVVTGPFPLEITAEQAFNGDDGGATGGITAELRSRNADQTVLTYVHPWQMREEWSLHPSTSLGKRMQTYLASVADSALFGKNLAHRAETRMEYPGTRFVNVMVPSTADTLAAYAVSAFDRSGADGEYCGLFVDDLVTTLTEYMCANGACDDVMDFDQDGTPYASDAQEKAAWQAWQVRFLKALRREFAERGMHNRLLAANSNFGRAVTMSAAGDTIMKLLDGHMTESPFEWWPGAAAADTTWERAFAIRDRLTTAQISPALQMFQVKSDSSIIDQSEVLALAADAWVCANQNTPENAYGNNNVPPMVPAIGRLPYPGLFSSVTYTDGGSAPDTLKATWSNITGRILLDHVYTSEYDADYGIWPYAIYPTGADLNDADSYLSRSKYWEIPEEAGAPSVTLQMNAQASVNGDRYNTIVWESNTALPSDFLGWFIYRDPCSGCDGNLYAEIPDVDPYGDGGLSWTYTDSSVTNGEEYTYLVAAVDANLNVSDSSDESDPLTPYDDTAPGVPTALKAAGGAGYIDLDWLGVTAADLVGYEVSRAPETGDGPGTYAVTDTVSVSAHQDSTALESDFYYYRVRALDDDGNRSAYTDAVIAAWYGDPDPPALPAPSNVMAWPDNPQGRTSVVMYAPADTTGLTGYQVFRGATADTGACVLYKTNVARGMFDGGVFEDLKANSDPDSTWYYTAKAMYGAGRSEKFHTPRPALTTGNFPTLVPSVFAYGSGSNIGVAWIGITGADSTLIYRGTTAGSQSWLATVAHGNNPYFDSTAAANTDYYYKVRLKDNPSTYSDYSTVFGPVRWNSVPSGDPAISGVTGTVSHGSTITIAGSSFGTNDVSGDFWDGLESGAFQSPWDVTQGGYSNGFSTVVSAGSNARHAGSNYVLKTSFPSTSGNAHQIIYRPPFTKLYAQYWVKLDNNFEFGGTGQSNSYGPTSLANVKFFRLWPYGSSNEDFVTAFHKYSATHSVTVEVENTEPYPHQWSAWGGFSNSDQFSKNTWHLLQFEYKSSSGQGVADGFFKMTFDGSVKFSRSDIVTMQDGVAEKDEIYLGFGDTTGGWNYDGANDVYFDDFYIAPTLARVEIGNASTYAACTHREIQIPSAWSATSITCTVNTGSFSSGAAYLFVIDEDGTVSAGKPITVE